MQGWDFGAVSDVNRAFVPKSSKLGDHCHVFNSSLSVGCGRFAPGACRGKAASAWRAVRAAIAWVAPSCGLAAGVHKSVL